MSHCGLTTKPVLFGDFDKTHRWRAAHPNSEKTQMHPPPPHVTMQTDGYNYWNATIHHQSIIHIIQLFTLFWFHFGYIHQFQCILNSILPCPWVNFEQKEEYIPTLHIRSLVETQFNHPLFPKQTLP